VLEARAHAYDLIVGPGREDALPRRAVLAIPGLTQHGLSEDVYYQLYRITLQPSAWLIALTIFDAFVVWLTCREWRKQRGSDVVRHGPQSYVSEDG
jgi:hypothetical protein